MRPVLVGCVLYSELASRAGQNWLTAPNRLGDSECHLQRQANQQAHCPPADNVRGEVNL
jgi:hypothetical protein